MMQTTARKMPCDPSKSDRGSRFLFLVRLFLLFAVSLGLCGFVGLAAYEWLSFSLDRENAEFERACGKCHSPERAHRYAQSPEDWRKTVGRMLDRDFSHGSRFGPESRERIAEFLIRRRSANGEILAKLRCARCHPRSTLDPFMSLEERALETLIQQHIRQNNFAIQEWEGDLIVGAVMEQRGSRPRDLDAGAARRQYEFQAFCGLCHDAGFLYRRMCEPPRDASEWREVVQRMAGKAPDAVRPDSVALFVGRSMEICANPMPRP